MEKPYSAAAERNKTPILEVLKLYITEDNKRLLEVGTGTGQHAVSLAPHFPHLQWVATDRSSYLPGIKQWIEEAKVPNVKGPYEFEVGKSEFPRPAFDLVFTANTFHIMSWKECKTLMKLLGQHLSEGAAVFIYGPFNYHGAYTSKSNEDFDAGLRQHDPASGIRAFEDVTNNMTKNGFLLSGDHEMPANNRLLVFTRIDFVK